MRSNEITRRGTYRTRSDVGSELGVPTVVSGRSLASETLRGVGAHGGTRLGHHRRLGHHHVYKVVECGGRKDAARKNTKKHENKGTRERLSTDPAAPEIFPWSNIRKK